MNRRNFILKNLMGAAVTSAGIAVSHAQNYQPQPTSKTGTEPRRGPKQDAQLVSSFVSAGHGNLTRIKELATQEPNLVYASWDWGGGDWETALGAAAHIGNREIAEFLLSAGTRIDSFAAAMLGQTDIVTSLVRYAPSIANARGPHGFSLLYHVAHGGEIKMAESVSPHLSHRPRDFNQALHSATQSRRTEMVSWLLKNGVTKVNSRNGFGKTPLDVAVERGYDDIAKILRSNGGEESPGTDKAK